MVLVMSRLRVMDGLIRNSLRIILSGVINVVISGFSRCVGMFIVCIIGLCSRFLVGVIWCSVGGVRCGKCVIRLCISLVVSELLVVKL